MSNTYKANDRHIKTLVQSFDVHANPTDQMLIGHLHALQSRLAKNRFDMWEQLGQGNAQQGQIAEGNVQQEQDVD